MFRLRKPSDHVLAQVLEDQRGRPFSYPTVGATAGGSGTGELPARYHHDRLETDLGPDDGDRFARAGQALLAWAPQRGAAIRVFPDQPVAADREFVLVMPLPVTGWALAPGRVAYLMDEPDRFGYAYGTLPGHPEQGEEAFVVIRADGRIRFEVIAFSRPQEPLARLGGPITRAFQVRTLRAYLRAMESAAR
ncbi:MAG: DUF1990 domain-containing protein [Actinomycetota bacterium]|nr:DUF1990 domain-containing protein [Actinomycetota bacterium]MDQ6948577.1 DUF1990 domain-containing protein [Actinomycetota bacterium]